MPVRRLNLKGGSLSFKRRRRNRYGQFASNGVGILVRRSELRRTRAKPEGGLLSKDTLDRVKALTRPAAGPQQRGQVKVKSAKFQSKPRLQKAVTPWSKG